MSVELLSTPDFMPQAQMSMQGSNIKADACKQSILFGFLLI